VGTQDNSIDRAAYFVVGGTVPPGSPSYVERDADQELYESLRSGEYCFVLNSRQMGKSSLAVRTIARLSADGIKCAFVDLTRLGGATVTPEQWYTGLTVETGRTLGLRTEAANFIKENRELGAVRRFLGFIQEVVLPAIDGPVVIMIDEIDAVRSLTFSADELFAGFRNLFNSRATQPEFSRLTICLLGAALPSDLIVDPRSTPFNIGRRIGLRDFTLEDIKPLANGFGPPGIEILRRVLYWSGGHPFLTQVLCSEMAKRSDLSANGVDDLVRERYLNARARETDTNLADVANRLLGRGDPNMTDAMRSDVLTVYSRLNSGLPDDEANPAIARIKMSGVARLDNGKLFPRNRIYSTTFDANWIKSNIPEQETRRQMVAYWRGVMRTGIGAATLIVAIAVLLAIALKNGQDARVAQAKTMASEEAERQLVEKAISAKDEALKSEAFARASLARARTAESEARQAAQQEHSAKVLAQRSEAAERVAQKEAIDSANLARRSESELRQLLYTTNLSLASGALNNGSGVQARNYLNGIGALLDKNHLNGWEYRYFQAVLHEAQEYPKLPIGVRKVAFNPQGKLLVLTVEGSVFLADSNRTDFATSFGKVQADDRLSVALPSNGSAVVCSLKKNKVEIRSPIDFHLVRTLESTQGPIIQADLSPNGLWLLGLFGNRERGMNLKTGACTSILSPGPWRSTMLIFPNGDGLDLRNDGLERRKLSPDGKAGVEWVSPGRQNTVQVFAMSSNGRYAAFSDSYGYAQVVDASNGRWVGKPISQTAVITAIAFDPSGTTVATASDDGVIRETDVGTGATIRTYRARQSHITSLAVAGDGRIGYGTKDGATGIFNPYRFDQANGATLASLTPLSTLSVSSDGNLLAAAGLGDRAVRVLDARTGAVKQIVEMESSGLSADFSPDSRSLAIGSSSLKDSTLGQLHIELVSLVNGKRRLISTKSMQIGSVRFSPNGKFLAVYEGSILNSQSIGKGLLQLFEVSTGKLVGEIVAPVGWIPSAEFSESSKYLAVCFDSGITKVFQTGPVLKERASLEAEREAYSGPEGDMCKSVCFSPDDRIVFVGRANGMIDAFDWLKSRRLNRLVAHTSSVNGIRLTPGKKTLVSVSSDRHAKFWALQDLRNTGDIQFTAPIFHAMVSQTTDTVYLAVGQGEIHAMRTVQRLVPPDKTPSPSDIVSFDKLLETARKSGKPLFLAITGQHGVSDAAYREFLSNSDVREFLNQHFIFRHIDQGQFLSLNGKVLPAFAALSHSISLTSDFPWSKIISGNGTVLWDGTIKVGNSGRQNAKVPQETAEINAFLKAISSADHTITNSERSRIGLKLKDLTEPIETSAMESDEQLGNRRTRMETLLTRNDLTAAKNLVNRLRQSAPAAAFPHTYQALIDCREGNWVSASEEFSRGLGRIRPALEGAYWQMMAALAISENDAEFGKRLRATVAHDSELPPLEALKLECLGSTMVPNAMDPKSVAGSIGRRYARELSDPVQLAPKVYYGLVLARAGRPREALALMNQAFAVKVRSVAEWRLMEQRRVFLASVYALQGRKSDAQLELKRAESASQVGTTDEQLIASSANDAIFAVIRHGLRLVLTTATP